MGRLKISDHIDNSAYNESLNTILLLLTSLSFALSDWMLGYFSFTEFFIGFILLLMLLSSKIEVDRNQIKGMMLLLLVLCIHLFLQHFFNDEFSIRTGIISVVKLGFYTVSITVLYNFIINNKLKSRFLYWNNVIAMIVCAIAVYIAVAIYLEGAIPWRFFVTFTRTGGNVYRRDASIIRMKSIFMEPAHLGYYLNTIIALNLFSRVKVKHLLPFTVILLLVSMATFSYSTIVVTLLMLTLLIVQLWKQQKLKEFKGLITGAAVVAAVFTTLFWNSIYQTFIERTFLLLQGSESSGYERLVLSWQFVTKDNFLLGNGITHTPNIWNNYAYFLSDFGIAGLMISLILTYYLLRRSFALGIVFILMNFVKGGYLSPAYWFMILGFMIFSSRLDADKRAERFGINYAKK